MTEETIKNLKIVNLKAEISSQDILNAKWQC